MRRSARMLAACICAISVLTQRDAAAQHLPGAHVCRNAPQAGGIGLAWLVTGRFAGYSTVHAQYVGLGGLSGLKLTGTIDTPPKGGYQMLHLVGAFAPFKSLRDDALLYSEAGRLRWLIVLGPTQSSGQLAKVPCLY